ncbi:MAG: MarC family protein [Deltaproteobacteria bacterium]|nr:MarC family protein [Deltaproteobacteria bacterium]MBW2260254.1 MarC family protein [Deltaproteobacteria bacterium]
MQTLGSLMTVLIPLLIITDPLGNLPFFLLFTERNTPSERRRMAAISSSTACVILAFFAITGDFVLRFFHISLPAFQLAGGFIFFIYALQMMRVIPSGLKSTSEEEKEGVAKENVALVPLATPLLAGPGAITAVLVWQQTPDSPVSTPLLLSAIVLTCLIIYLVFHFGASIIRVMGVGGIRVVTRLMGLLLAVIAVQFMVSGYLQIR